MKSLKIGDFLKYPTPKKGGGGRFLHVDPYGESEGFCGPWKETFEVRWNSRFKIREKVFVGSLFKKGRRSFGDHVKTGGRGFSAAEGNSKFGIWMKTFSQSEPWKWSKTTVFESRWNQRQKPALKKTLPWKLSVLNKVELVQNRPPQVHTHFEVAFWREGRFTGVFLHKSR